MSHFQKMNFNGDPNLGLFGFATESYCLLGVQSKKICRKAQKTLRVPVFHANLLRSELIGIFMSGNSNGIVVPEMIEEEELASLRDMSEKIFGKDRVLVLRSINALGNLILMNDHGIIISPIIRKERQRIADFFRIPCDISTIAKINVVGSLALATNKGCLTHPNIRKNELETLQSALKVPIDIGTVGFGSSFPGAGVIANDNGFLASETTSGIEMGRIDHALGFI